MDNKKIRVNADKIKTTMKYVKATIFVVFYIFFWCHKDFFSQISEATGVPTTDLLLKRITIVTVLCGAGILGSLWEIKLSDRLNKIVLAIVVILTPVVNFLNLEYVNIQKSRVLFEVFKDYGFQKSALSIFVILLIMVGIYIISNRLKVATIGVSIFIAIFGTLCYYVFEFRGIPFLASDLSTIDAAMSVMGNYNYNLSFQMFGMLLITLFWCVVITKLKNEPGLKWKVRLGFLVPYIIIVAISIHTFIYTTYLRVDAKVSFNTFQPQKSYGGSGSILVVIRSIQLILVEKPEGYEIKVAEEIAANYPVTTVENTVKPNVIIVMDEAFSDLQAINSFKTNKEVLPFFNSLKENVVRGDVYVSGFGGRTANSEFEVLTGLSQAFTPPSATPYQLFIKDTFPSLTQTLKRQGYQGNIAMHPHHKTGYNRFKAYPLMGFEEFLSIDDFDGVKKIRQHVSDEATFDRIIQEYEEAKMMSNEPFYSLAVTMQNHAGYGKDFENLPKEIEIVDEKFKNADAERYLNLVHLSDKALEQLITYFEGKEPTVVVFFGDHQPKLSDAFYEELLGKPNSELTDEEMMEKYKTQFVIWANYDIEEKENVKTSTNYLSTLMVESAKMQPTRWNDFLSDTAKEISVLNVVGYFGADGIFYDRKDETSPYYETLTKYQILQYNYMFDKGKRIENFFE